MTFITPVTPVEMIRIQLGALSLAVPREVLSLETQQGQCREILRFQHDDLCFWAQTPRAEAIPPLGDIIDPSYRSFRTDVISLQIAAYTADPRSLSIGMSTRQAGWLRQLVEIRRCLWTDVDHIEVIERVDMRGVLVVRSPLDGRIRTLLEYQSPDGALSGAVGFSTAQGSLRGIALGRAIVGSIQLRPDLAVALPSNTEICPDSVSSLNSNLGRGS